MPQRLSALFLLLLVCLLSCMLPVRYGLKQAAKLVMQERIEHRDEDGKSVLIAASDVNGARWEGQHEFRLRGQLYDVAGEVCIDGHKYYRCFTDELELRMEHGADKLAGNLFDHHADNKDGKVIKSLIDWLQDLYLQPPSHNHNLSLATNATTYYITHSSLLDDPFLSCRIVPPEA